MPQYCYILYNDTNNKTYNGYTVDLTRRLRQHNGELKGGAKYTTRARVVWKYLAIVECPPEMDKKDALALEWMIRYPTRRKPRPAEFNGPKGRLKGLELALRYERWAHLLFDITITQNEKGDTCEDQKESDNTPT